MSGGVVGEEQLLLSWLALLLLTLVISQTLSLVLPKVEEEVLLTMAASPQPMPSNF